MSTLLDLLQVVKTMGHNEIDNYVLPGLTSSLIGGFGQGRVRLFLAERETREWVIPHSHRFDFGCLVMHGWVENILFVPGTPSKGQPYGKTTIRQGDTFGKYSVERGDVTHYYQEQPTRYGVGECYCMKAEEIHSIRFGELARVLFFEGPEKNTESIVLEPWCNGAVVPTFETASWMFKQRRTSARHGGSDG